jgi:hypothetical protein
MMTPTLACCQTKRPQHRQLALGAAGSQHLRRALLLLLLLRQQHLAAAAGLQRQLVLLLLPCLVAASSLSQWGALRAGAQGKSEGSLCEGRQALVCVAVGT